MANGLTVRFTADASQYLATTNKVEQATKKATTGLETTAGKTEFALGKLIGRAAGMQGAFAPLAQFAPALAEVGMAAGPVAIAFGGVTLAVSEMNKVVEQSIENTNRRIKAFDDETAAMMRISAGTSTAAEESSRMLVEQQKAMRDDAVKKYASSWDKYFDAVGIGNNEIQKQIALMNEEVRAAEEQAVAVKKIEDAKRAEAKAAEAANAERKKTLESMLAEYRMVEVLVNGQKKMVLASGKAFGGENISDLAEAERQIRNMQEALGEMSQEEQKGFQEWAAQKRLDAESKVNREIFQEQSRNAEELAKKKAEEEKKAQAEAEKKSKAAAKEKEQISAAEQDQTAAKFSDAFAKSGLVIGGTTQGLDVQKEQLSTLKEIKKNTAKAGQTITLG